ncbi:MAG: dihydroxyacetone kinase subunit DhaK, partial [Clostridia bacterium]|nr:dihydroxyacetone kinase subunit DhaK [Clostridia bacterium]
IKVDAVYVNDDIAVKDSLYTVGRRGVAGTVLVHKCAGAAAEQGKELEEVKRVANKVIENVRSFGFAFTSCTVPAAGHPTFEIGDDEMEFGVGIHGEPGRFREKIDYSKGTFSDDLSRRIVNDLEEDLKLAKDEEVVLLINGFGGTPLQELYILNNSVTKALGADGIKIHRTIVGNFMTSIDMAGASITVLRVDAELKALIDYPVSTPALTWGAAMGEQAEAALEAVKAIGKALNITPQTSAVKAAKKAAQDDAVDANAVYVVEGTPVVTETINTAAFVKIVDKMADVIIENEVPFCEADKMGDGDFGMSIAKGFRQLKADWATRKKGDIGQFLVSCSDIIKEYCGGASGPIWG